MYQSYGTRWWRKFRKKHRIAWLLRITAGKANPLMVLKVGGALSSGVVTMVAGHLVRYLAHMDVVWGCAAVVVAVMYWCL